MDKITEIISELQIHGISVSSDRNTCSFMENGTTKIFHLNIARKKFNSNAEKHKEMFFSLWNELVNHLYTRTKSAFASSDLNKAMFINSIKNAKRICNRYDVFAKNCYLFDDILRHDIDAFSDAYLSDAVQMAICIEWLYYSIKVEVYKAFLVETLMESIKTVTASGSMGNVDLDMKSRVQVLDEDTDELEDDGRLHPMYTSRFRQYDLQHGKDAYDIEDRVYRLMNGPSPFEKKDERQPNRSLTRTV